MGKFVILNTNTGIKFDLKAGNGEVIATSEVYTTEDACRIEHVISDESFEAIKKKYINFFENTPSK